MQKEEECKKSADSQQDNSDEYDNAEELEAEINERKTRPLSASSDGSVADPYGGSRKHNPFIKAISSQRKDFSYVTQLRKEVIHIVEPFR